MTRRLLSSDPYTGIDTFHEHDSLANETTIIHIGDCEPYLEANKRLANDPEYTKRGFKNEFYKYASIPPAIQVKWLLEDGIDVYNRDHGARIGAKLNDPEWRYLKTTTKHHTFK